jgi:hypothetical protein
MSTKKREVIFGPRLMGAKIPARRDAKQIGRKRNYSRHAWKATVARRNRRRPSANVSRWPWLAWCKTRASLPLDAIRRPRDTPVWKLEAALKCRSCKKGRYAPGVHLIKLTQKREITPYPLGASRRRSVSGNSAGEVKAPATRISSTRTSREGQTQGNRQPQGRYRRPLREGKTRRQACLFSHISASKSWTARPPLKLPRWARSCI